MEHTTITPTAFRTELDRDVAETLDRLLDAELDYRVGARSGFISHLSMSLVAAARLGAGPAELEEWYDGQTSGDFLIPRDRPSSLGSDAARIRRDGIDAEVRRRLPALIVAPASQFFHAPIRLELAIDAGHVGQVANALDNWEANGTALADPPSGNGDRNVGEVTRRVLARAEAATGSPPGLDGVAEQPWFAEEVGHLRVDDHTLDELAVLAAASHVQPRHFGTLHLVTGMRAVRALMPHLDTVDRREAARRAAHAFLAAMVSFGGRLPDGAELDARRRSAPAGWFGLADAALDSGDAHVAKLVYASMLEESATGDPLHRAVAAMQVGR